MRPLDRRDRILVAAILATGLLVRLAYLASLHHDLLYEHPILDEQQYVDGARRLADGQGIAAEPYWQPPGIIYVLAACFRIVGPGLTAPRLLAILVSVATCLLVFAVGRRLFDSRVALGACATCALHGVLVFESCELLPATYILACAMLGLWLLIAAERARGAFAAGLAFGVAALFSPTVLPFVAVAAAWLRRWPLTAALVLGAALPVAPVTARNVAHGGEWVLVSTNGGLNFFLGNNARYAETIALRPGRRWEELTAEPSRHGVVAPGAASSYFFCEGLAFIRAEPARALALYARKLYLFFNGGEIPRDSDLYAERAESPILRVLVWPGPLRFPDGLIIPLALTGAFCLWRERKRLFVLYAFVAVQALVTAAFFVSARHRVPALAAFALFAAAALPELRRRPRLAALALALVVVLNLPTREAALSWAAEGDFYRGLAELRQRHDPPAAVGYFERAAARDPGDERIWFELGNALDAAGRAPEAIDAWKRAAAVDAWDVRPRRRASALLLRAGDLDGAIAVVQANVDARLREPAIYAPDWLNLAFLHARRGDVERAIAALRACAEADPLYFHQHAPGLPRGEVAAPRFWQALDELLR